MKIPLSKGHHAVIDDDDYGTISKHKWYATSAGDGRKIYAYRKTRTANGKRTQIAMHREIVAPPDSVCIDHINGDSLDNRRCNLRIATPSQNQQNRGLQRNNKSGARGVFWCADLKKWRSSIQANNKRRHLGDFSNIEDAKAVRECAEYLLHGAFAFRTNY